MFTCQLLYYSKAEHGAFLMKLKSKIYMTSAVTHCGAAVFIDVPKHIIGLIFQCHFSHFLSGNSSGLTTHLP